MRFHAWRQGLRNYGASWFSVACLLAATAAEGLCGDQTTASPQASTAPSQPNIIFILVDDLGYGDVGVFFQHELAQQADRHRPWHFTPTLDRLAAEGIQLPHHYCPAPVCAPSRASLLLGVHQGHANVRDNQFDKELEDNHTLASVLKTAGYHTIAVGKYGLQGGQERENIDGPDWPAHPNRRGFDDYYGYIRHRDGHEHYPHEGIHRGKKEVWENDREVSAGLAGCYTTDLFTARAKQSIVRHRSEAADQPFFLYLAYDTPHAVLSLPSGPYPAGSGLSGGLQWLGTPGEMINTAGGTPDSHYHPDYADATWDHDNDPATAEVPWPDVQKRYATVVRRIDQAVGDILDLLRDLNIDQETLVVFTNDNGPSVESYLPENFQPTFFQGYGPFTGIKRDCLEGGVHVGALARWPNVIPAGSTSGDHATAFWDWLPTFAEAAGVPVPARSDGVSLMPLLSGKVDQQAASTIYVEYFQQGKTPSFADFAPQHRDRRRGQMQMIREGNLVGLRYQTQSAETPLEIYDIVADPRQAINLADQQADVQQRMQNRIVRLRRPNASAPRPYDQAPVPALTTAELEGWELQPGVRWNATVGNFPWVPVWPDGDSRQVADSTAAVDAALAGIGRNADESSPHLAVKIEGLIDVPVTGVYQLTIDAPGKYLLRVHEATVIDADRGALEPAFEGKLRLAEGKHPFQLTMLLDRKASAASVQWNWKTPGAAAAPMLLGKQGLVRK